MSDQKRPTGGRGLVSLRVSDPRQDLASQRKIIEKWLDDYGLAGHVVEWFSDVGSRVEAYAREGFQQMLKRVERGDIDWIVVEALDRFGVRSGAELGKFVCFLQDHDVKLYAIREQIEVTAEDAYTALMTTVGTLRSNDELLQRAGRSLKGRAERFKNGEHGGGPAPFGYATQCQDRLGVATWRLEIVGHERRVQIFPDGRRVPFDGKRNTPKKNQGERIVVVPSVHTERHEWVRQIFQWYTTEDISFMGIATRLNNLKVDALNGKGWSGPRIKQMLDNPAYVVGRTVGNKTGRGKVLGLVGGEAKPVERVGGKTGRFTKRDQTDYIFPSPTFGREAEPIIDRETWDKAQNKAKTLAHDKGGTRPRSARNQNTWLAGLLVCGRCDGKMAGFRRKHGTHKHNYCCTHHRRYGAQSTCKLNRVAHPVIEALVDRYLQEAQIKLDTIAGTGDPAGCMRALQMVNWSRQREYLGTLAQMAQALHEAGIETGMEIEGQHYDTCNIKQEYKKLHDAKMADLAETIKQKEEELRGFIRNIPRLSSELMIRMAEEEVEKLGKEIEEHRKQAQPLDERAEELRQAIVVAREGIREAREALAGGSGRHQAEALRKCLRRIVLHFTDAENPGMGEPTSILERVVFEPLEGDPLELVPAETPACHHFARHHLLSRTFLACEILTITINRAG